MLQKKRIQRVKLIFIMILVYSVCCLPFSLKNALSLWFPLSDENILNGPVLHTLLYLLCASQFSLNFVIYTIIPNQMREVHLNMWKKLWTYLKTKAQKTQETFPVMINSKIVIPETRLQFSDSSYRNVLESTSTDSSQSIPESPRISNDDILGYLANYPTTLKEDEIEVTYC